MKDKEGWRTQDEERDKGKEGGSGKSAAPRRSRFPLFLSCHLSTFLNDSSHVRAPSSLSFPFASLLLSLSPSLALSLSLLLSMSLFRFLFLDPSLSILSSYSSLSLRARNFEDTTCLERDFSTSLKWESKMAIRNFKLDCVSALVRPGMWCFMGSSYVVNAPRIVSIASFLTFGVKRSLEFRPLIYPCQTDFFYLVFSLNCRKQITKL